MLVKKQVEETVEVTLPFFSVEDSTAHKVYYAIYEKVSFEVLIGTHVCLVSIVNDSDKIKEAIKKEPITEIDFDFAYQMALDRLQKSITNEVKQAV